MAAKVDRKQRLTTRNLCRVCQPLTSLIQNLFDEDKIKDWEVMTSEQFQKRESTHDDVPEITRLDIEHQQWTGIDSPTTVNLPTLQTHHKYTQSNRSQKRTGPLRWYREPLQDNKRSDFSRRTVCNWLNNEQRCSHGVAKAIPIPSNKKYKAFATYSIYNIHIAH